MTERVTPATMPLGKGEVQSAAPSSQKILLEAPSATKPSLFRSSASSAPASSASARAMMCGSLLQLLNCASGSFANKRIEDVVNRHRGGGSGSSGGAVCNDITNDGR